MKTSRIWRSVVLAGLLAFPGAAEAQSTYLIDTGPGSTSSIGGSALFASGSTTCSPQPACSSHFQFLAARFTLTEAATIEGVELWIAGFGTGGSMDVKIREDANGLPSTNAPPLRSANSIYSNRYTGLSDNFNVARWVVFDGYEAVLAAGTYWVTFEPVHGSGLNYSVPGGAPAPLGKYAFFSDGNNRWVELTGRQMGVRLRGATFPGVGFGTATRTILKGSTFGLAYDEDRITAGTRDFTPIGHEGPALTSSYFFVTPGGYVHGHGKLIENGLSAGAYAITDGGCIGDCNAAASGAGRGIAYRTFINLSGQTRTFRVNANLHGSFGRLGGVARGGVYAFDAESFFSVLSGAAVPPEQFLLQADDMADLSDTSENISLARFFPGAVLSAQLVTALFPVDTPGMVPIQTGFISLAPGDAVTVMFDVAVYAPPGGAVNFASTLRPAADFLTDMSGQVVVDIVAVGPLAPPSAAPAAIALTPASGTTPLGSGHTLTAVVTGANGLPIPDVPVTFTVASGPQAGFTQQVASDVDGEVAFTYFGSALGTDTITATVGTITSVGVTNTWTAGAPHSIVASPANATINAGGQQAYSAEAFDQFGNSLGDVTAASTFSISPEGSCTGSTCTAAAGGTHTVTGTYLTLTAEATLEVNAGGGFTFGGFESPIDAPPVVNVVKAGSAIPIRFSLGGFHGMDILAAGSPSSQAIACDVGAPSDLVVETVTAGSSGLTYDAATDRYIYVWKTDKSWAKSCRKLTLVLSDGSTHHALFRLSQ